MVDIQKQIDYWISGAEDDIITANLLINEYFGKTKELLQWLKMKL